MRNEEKYLEQSPILVPYTGQCAERKNENCVNKIIIVISFAVTCIDRSGGSGLIGAASEERAVNPLAMLLVQNDPRCQS